MSRRRRVRRPGLLLAGTLLIAGCGSNTPTLPPVTAAPSVAEVPPPPSAEPPPSPAPTPGDPFLDEVVVTVSDGLRVRSLPEVSDASIKYGPVLPLGTVLRVVGGPVSGSGYTWYEVTLIDFGLDDSISRGWVAMAGKDGELWIALANTPLSGLETAMSSTARAPSDPADAVAAADSIAGFGLDLYHEMLAPGSELRDRNMVFSPTSIALALGMARLGAEGETGSEMDRVLRVRDQGDLQAGLNSLDQALASRGGWYTDDEGKSHQLTLRIANASFAQRAWSIEPAYLDAIASAFGTGLNLLDYIADPQLARRIINSWVSQRTADRIPELLDEPDVTELTRLYLVNAIYLKANWLVPFAKDETAPRPFRRLDGSTVTVPTMRLAGDQNVPYLSRDGWRAIELRYQGPGNSRPLGMMLIDPDDIESFERAMSAGFPGALGSDLTAELERLDSTVEYLSGDESDCGTYPYSVDLFMPRFSIETKAKLVDPLTAMGMPLAFDGGQADFTGIHVPEFEGDSIYIANVVHQANIDVDELGTEAAAATAVGMDTGGCTVPSPAKRVVLRLDRPFLFIIRDIETSAILFMGRVVDPSVGR